jgi:uncharacterized protein (TIGR02996 family)
MSAEQPRSTREALEEAIRESPDDRAAHSAYADLLTEEGDPRGEFIQVQLALEGPGLPRKEREQLKRRERKLRQQHEREWLGPLAGVLLDQTELEDWQRDLRRYHSRPLWRHGVLSGLYFGRLTLDAARALRDSTDRLACLRELRIPHVPLQEYGTYDPGTEVLSSGQFDTVAFNALTTWPLWRQVRVLQLGDFEEEDYGEHSGFGSRVDGEHAGEILRQMRDVEELYLFARNLDPAFSLPRPRLRVLQYYHGDYYTAGELAKNSSLANLTHLLIHPHEPTEFPTLAQQDFDALVRSSHLPRLEHLRLRLHDLGDAACRSLVDSGILERLETLDLRHGTITDEGARLLAACPDFSHLETLDISRNCLSDEGIALLRATRVRIEAGWQGALQRYEGGGESYHEYLYEGDQE